MQIGKCWLMEYVGSTPVRLFRGARGFVVEPERAQKFGTAESAAQFARDSVPPLGEPWVPVSHEFILT
jgi:hypothetical protein